MRRALVVLSFVACSPRPGADEVAESPRSRPEPGVPRPAAPADEPVDAGKVETVTELPPAAPDDGPARARAEFARSLARIKPGATDAEVRRSLGAPDDVKTERDPGGISAARTIEVWRYGTNGHLSFGTLGTVHIQADRTVQYVFGGEGTPARIEEAELRRLLRVLAAVPSYNGRFDPLREVQAVNALHRLGKADALAVIEEFLRVSSPFDDPGREGIFYVLRALFDPPPGQVLPPMMVGAPSPSPADPKALPRFPLVIVDDIPLCVTRGWSLGGMAEQPEDHLRWYRAHGLLRAAPLRPTDTPLATIDREFAAGSPLAIAAGLDDDGGRAFLRDQALQLLDTVVRPRLTLYDEPRFTPGPDAANRWSVVRAAVERLGPTWDAARGVYTMKGGELLAPTRRPMRPRALWDLPLPGAANARLALEWSGPQSLDVEVRVGVGRGGASKPAQLRLVDEVSGAAIAEVPLPSLVAPVDSTSGSVNTRRIAASPGVRLRAELVVDGAVVASDSMSP